MECDKNTDFKNLINCLESIHKWCNGNFLKLNNDKTKIMALSSKSYKSDKISQLKIMGETIQVESSARNLGFVFDEYLTMSKQINQVCSQGYGMLRNLWKISKKVTDVSLRTQLVHSGILSRVDYCNSLYVSLPKLQTNKLQKLINASARFILNITGKDRFEHITPHLQKLHFLPINYRIKFKICLMSYKCIHNLAPSYLIELINIRQPNWERSYLRKDADGLLLTHKNPSVQNYKNRSFSFTAPNYWNKIVIEIRQSPSVTLFKSKLKTEFYTEWVDGTI